MAFLAGTALAFNILSVEGIGATNDVSLQAPQMQIMSAEPITDEPPVNDFAADLYSDSSLLRDERIKKDDLDSRTIIVSSDDLYEEQILDPDEFIHDGSRLWVSVDCANLRSLPDTDSDIITKVNYASELLRISYGSFWSLVRLDDGTEGYMMTSLLSDDMVDIPKPSVAASVSPVAESITPSPVPTLAPALAPTSTPTPTPAPTPSFTESPLNATCYASCVMNVRQGPGTDYALISGLNPGDAIDIVAITDNGWYKTSDGCYVKADLCLDSWNPVETNTVAGDGASSDASHDTASYSDFGNYCLQFVGTPYVYSGASPSGFDCSGFVSYVYASYYGISLPHNAAEIASLGTSASSDNIAAGDVICHDYNNDGYIDHVSLYIGNGTCVHASNSRYGVVTASWPMGAVVSIRRFV